MIAAMFPILWPPVFLLDLVVIVSITWNLQPLNNTCLQHHHVGSHLRGFITNKFAWMELLWSILLCAYKAELTDKEKATWQKVNLVTFLVFLLMCKTFEMVKVILLATFTEPSISTDVLTKLENVQRDLLLEGRRDRVTSALRSTDCWRPEKFGTGAVSARSGSCHASSATVLPFRMVCAE